jgi:hypothetical protein
LRSRKEAVEFLHNYNINEKYELSGCNSYGKYDLRILLDFIYDGVPKDEDEKLQRIDKDII